MEVIGQTAILKTGEKDKYRFIDYREQKPLLESETSENTSISLD